MRCRSQTSQNGIVAIQHPHFPAVNGDAGQHLQQPASQPLDEDCEQQKQAEPPLAAIESLLQWTRGALSSSAQDLMSVSGALQ